MKISVGAELGVPRSRRRVRLERFIGEGSQGTVYETVDLATGERSAFKWYFPQTATAAQRRAIGELVDRGSPDHRFLWPNEIVDDDEPGGGFGYFMDLRPSRCASLSELLTGAVDVPFSVVCTLGMELASGFLSLHSEGLCYRDISFSNVFFDPLTGGPLICDNDNVGIDGDTTSAVLGTRRFMAPEIVRREASPSTRTDLYSLSVLLFYLLMVGHPLVGRRELDHPTWDDDAESILFGREPLFVFDPDDAGNAPLPDLHANVVANWEIYPAFIRQLFTRSFTVGLTDPEHGRVRESVWRSAFSRLRDQVLRCHTCSKENYWSADGTAIRCWSCEGDLQTPLRLEIDDRTLVLNEDTRVCSHHLHMDYDFATTVASVTRHPDHPDRWGLRNESARTWTVRTVTGGELDVPPSRSVALVPDTRIDLGTASARLTR